MSGISINVNGQMYTGVARILYDEVSGTGETPAIVITTVIDKAIFDATGACIRTVLFTPEGVTAALHARTAA